MNDDEALRAQLVKLLDWREAHVDIESAIDGIPSVARGRTPAGASHSLWQLIEHIRIAQHDILDFCVNPAYKEKSWPEDYWPPGAAPPSAGAWDEAIGQIRSDRKALQLLVRHTPNLLARIPHGSGQTYLRELLLVADHTAYHVGQMVLVRRLLGVWET